MAKRSKSLFTADLVLPAISDLFLKLNPAQLIRNPVMFVTAAVAALMTVLLVIGHDGLTTGVKLQLVVWLWLTVLFGTFAEALAEGRGKEQAASLRATKAELTAKRLQGDGRAWDDLPASQLKIGDVVLVETNDLIPSDGEVIAGVASIDEAAITGESAPVIREAGGDRSAVTADIDRIVVAINELPGADTLVRAAKRVADGLHGPWTAVFIETPRAAQFSDAQHQRVAAAMTLATQLGAAVATVPAADVVEGIQNFLADARATQLVMGKSRRSRWFEFLHGSVVDR